MDLSPDFLNFRDTPLRPNSNNSFHVSTPERLRRKVPINKYESVLTSLQVLKKFSTLYSSDKLPKNDLQTEVGRVNKKITVGKEPTAEKSFTFTKDMFMNSNQSSEAFIRVTHFLFSLLDKTETETRFRDAWPIYERKQEGLFRRATLAWFKEIIEGNQSFFAKGVEVQLQGLIVNPYGDRFIRFFHNFVTFVMFTVSSREDAIPDSDGYKDPILYKPKFTGKPEATKRQVIFLECRTEKLEKLTVDWMRTLTRNQILSFETDERIKNEGKQAEKSMNKRIAGLNKLISQKPQYFPGNAIEQIQGMEQYFIDKFQNYPLTSVTAIDKISPHPLNIYVDNIWKKQLELLGHKVNQVTDFFLHHQRLWILLNLIPTQKSVELDVSKLHFPPNYPTNELLSVHQFFDGVATSLQNFNQKLQDVTISKEFLDKVQKLNLKVGEMEQNAKRISAIQGPTVKELTKKVDFEINTLYIRLENVDWSSFSQVHDPPLSTMFSFSPARIVNPLKETGLTPALSSYLNFESRSISAELKNESNVPVISFE